MTTEIKNKIKDFVLEYNKANVEHDKVKITEMLGDVKHLKHITGYVQPLNEWFEGMDNGEFPYRKFEMGEIEILSVEDNVYEITYPLTIFADSVWPFRNVQKLIIHENGTIKWFNVNHFTFNR